MTLKLYSVNMICVFYSLVRNPEGRIRLYCKGADTVLLERLHPCNQELINITSDHLNVSKHTHALLCLGMNRPLLPSSVFTSELVSM